MTRRSEYWIGALLGAATLLLLAGLALRWPGAVPPAEPTQYPIKGAAGLMVVALLALAHFSGLRRSKKLRLWIFALAALVGVVSYSNFGSFHYSGFAKQHEMFHYFLGSKYFPELGYDGLYAASVAAQRERDVDLPVRRIIRDLRTNQIVPTASVEPHVIEVVHRFTPERWRRFVSDHHQFVLSHTRYINGVRIDHGYNPSPTWTFVGRLLSGKLTNTRPTLVFLACLDVVLLIAMFTVVFRSYGIRIGTLSLAIFCVGYGWRLNFIGGSFLRADWLAASVIGFCMLKRERYALAGDLFGYATAVRIFPAFFLMGPAVLAARQLVRREKPAWALRLAAGFAVVMLLGLFAGSLTGRGAQAWPEFADNIRLHQRTWPPNRVGLDNVILNAPALFEHGLAEPSLPHPQPGSPDVPGLGSGVPLKIALLLLLVLAMWQASLAQAAAMGIAAIFILTPLGCYYWVMLLALPLATGTALSFGLLLLSTGMYGVHVLYDDPFLRFAIKSLGLTVLLLGWILPGAIDTLRRKRAPTAPEGPERLKSPRELS